jgi:hypothetical protein
MSELIFSSGPIQLSHPQTGTQLRNVALALLAYLVIEVDHPHTRDPAGPVA